MQNTIIQVCFVQEHVDNCSSRYVCIQVMYMYTSECTCSRYIVCKCTVCCTVQVQVVLCVHVIINYINDFLVSQTLQLIILTY